jgi:hypothetical protein
MKHYYILGVFLTCKKTNIAFTKNKKYDDRYDVVVGYLAARTI